MSDIDNLLPEDKKWILKERDLEEGDIFPLGDGKRAEYDGRKFVITKKGQVLGRISVPNRNRKRR
jgi:type IV secretory pathway protease TraF